MVRSIIYTHANTSDTRMYPIEETVGLILAMATFVKWHIAA